MSYGADLTKLAGRKVLAVDGETLYLDDGKAWRFRLEGDCCSSSSFTDEGLAAFSELAGRTIVEATERTDSRLEDWAAREAALVEKYPPGDVDSWHFLVFVTDKGHVTVDWRNESNGYYDGTLEMDAADPLPPVVQDALLEGRPDAIWLAVRS